MSDENFNCCLCGQEWQKDAGYASKNNNNLCYECIVDCAGWVLGGKDRLREIMFGKGEKE